MPRLMLLFSSTTCSLHRSQLAAHSPRLLLQALDLTCIISKGLDLMSSAADTAGGCLPTYSSLGCARHVEASRQTDRGLAASVANTSCHVSAVHQNTDAQK